MTGAAWRGGSSRAWRKIRMEILERDAWRCQLAMPGCTKAASVVDHIRPKSKGGTDTPENLRAACRACNARRGDGRTPDESRATVRPLLPSPRPDQGN